MNLVLALRLRLWLIVALFVLVTPTLAAAGQGQTVYLKQGEGPTQAMRHAGCNLWQVSEVLRLSSLVGRRMDRLPIGQRINLPDDCGYPHDTRTVAASRLILRSHKNLGKNLHRAHHHHQLRQTVHSAAVVKHNVSAPPLSAPAPVPSPVPSPAPSSLSPVVNPVVNIPIFHTWEFWSLLALAILAIAAGPYLGFRFGRNSQTKIKFTISGKKYVALSSKRVWSWDDVAERFLKREYFGCALLSSGACNEKDLGAEQLLPHMKKKHKALWIEEVFVKSKKERFQEFWTSITARFVGLWSWRKSKKEEETTSISPRQANTKPPETET